jgi:hypothetical protein
MTNPVTRTKTKPITGNIFEENAKLNDIRYSNVVQTEITNEETKHNLVPKKIITVKKRKVNINIRIEHDQDVEIKKIAKNQKVSYAETIRFLINEGINTVNK